MATIQDLETLFPWAFTLLTEDKDKGLTMSVAQQKKESNHNEAAKLLNDLKFNERALYKCSKLYYHNSGIEKIEVEKQETPTVEMFSQVDNIADKYAESAIYGAGIKLKNQLLTAIGALDQTVVYAHLQLEKLEYPRFSFEKKQATRNSLDTFVEMSKVEEMVPFMSKDLILKIGNDTIAKALAVEAKASVYGKQSADPKSFLRKLSSASSVFSVGEEGIGKTVSTYTLDVNKSDYEGIDTELKDKHNKYQSEKNGYLKTIKDAARELQRQYDEEYSIETEKHNSLSDKIRSAIRSNNAKVETFKTSLLQVASSLYIVNTL